MFRLRRSAMFRGALAQPCHDLLIQIAHDQLSHAINDSILDSLMTEIDRVLAMDLSQLSAFVEHFLIEADGRSTE